MVSLDFVYRALEKSGCKRWKTVKYVFSNEEAREFGSCWQTSDFVLHILVLKYNSFQINKPKKPEEKKLSCLGTWSNNPSKYSLSIDSTSSI